MAEPTSGDLAVFMAAIRRLESGSYSGDYLAGYNKGEAHAKGAYQIMPQYWDDWAREAGIPGADPRDPAAQDFVATYRMTKLYREFGDWRLVAIAWFSGRSRALKAQRDGIASLANIKDSYGTTVPGYVKLIDAYMLDYAEQKGYDWRPESMTAETSPGLLPGEGTTTVSAPSDVMAERNVQPRRSATTNVGALPSPIGFGNVPDLALGGRIKGGAVPKGSFTPDIEDPKTTASAVLTTVLTAMSEAIKATSKPVLDEEARKNREEREGLII